MTKFTSGPWSFSLSDSPFIDNGHTIDGYKGTMAHIEGWEEDDPEEAEANARLMAAAPELLEALQTVLANPEEISMCATAYSISLAHPVTPSVKARAEKYAKVLAAIDKATKK